MRALTLILTDFYLEPGAIAAGSALPRLPALETVLARGAPPLTRDWRVWACEQTGLQLPMPLPVAAVARCANADSPAGDWWFASAVHLIADLDRVRLLRLAPQSIDQGEWQELIEGFNSLFAAEGLQLDGVCGAEAFMSCTPPLAARTTDPARLQGDDLYDRQPEGPDAQRLRRVMTEVQMWLHAHPLNERRAARQFPTINGLWIWGGGNIIPAGAPAQLPVLWSDDCFLRGLWRLRGGHAETPPAALPRESGMTSNRGEEIVVALRSNVANGSGPHRQLAEIERLWIAPALVAVRGGRLQRLRLLINDRLHELRRGQLLRFWRRRRHWLEALT